MSDDDESYITGVQAYQWPGELLELVSLEGDVPEARPDVPLPIGVRAAVPIIALSANPEVLGLMLREASSRVTQAAAELRTSLVAASENGGLIPDPEGYQRGQAPVPVEVQLDDGAALGLAEELARVLRWEVLSTRRGRLSACPAITEAVVTGLADRGVQVELGRSARPPDDSHSWSVVLEGPECVQVGFDYVGTASAALLAKSPPEGKYLLEVVPMADVPGRRFGWQLNLWRDE